MVTFHVQDMSCGHCVRSITQAVLAIDPGAQVAADLATHRVRIEAAGSDGPALYAAIRDAGYTPVVVEEAAAGPAQPAPRSACCCR